MKEILIDKDVYLHISGDLNGKNNFKWFSAIIHSPIAVIERVKLNINQRPKADVELRITCESIL